MKSPARASPGGEATFSVLLATFNGERFLAQQLETLANQSVRRLDVFASDDGSMDRTASILDRCRAAWSAGSFQILDGPAKGFAENFRSLILQASASTEYVAFCDQDDLWDGDKLAVAANALAPYEKIPAVYFSRTRLINAEGQTVGHSPLFTRRPSFRNALVQSIGGGNSTVLNRRGYELVRESSRRTGFVSHDWWCYLIVTGAGGTAIYDPIPHVGYRQHGGNLVGHNTGFSRGVRRLSRLAHGTFSAWTSRNVAGLRQCRDLLSDEGRTILYDFSTLRAKRSLTALRQLRHHGFYRQTAADNVALGVAAMLGRI